MKKHLAVALYFGILFLFSSNINAQTEAKMTNEYHAGSITKAPEFPGGMLAFNQFIAKNYKIPEDLTINVQVWIDFIVEENGSLSDIRVIRDPGYNMGTEAIRVMQISPKWNPGDLHGKVVKTRMAIPIKISPVNQ